MATPQWTQITEWCEFPNPDSYAFYSQEQTWASYPPAIVWTVIDSAGTVVENATLTIGGTDYTTDANGQIEINSLAQGSYTVALSKTGYLSYEWTEELHTGAAIEYRTVELPTLDQVGMPEAQDVEVGVVFAGGDRTGVFEAPAEAKVIDGIGFGADGTEYTGTVILPVVSDVRDGIGFGADGTEYVGDVVVPLETQVRLNVDFGANESLTGVFVGESHYIEASVSTPSFEVTIETPDVEADIA